MDAAARDRAFQLMSGFRSTQMVRAMAELKIPDMISASPRSADDLAASTGVQADPLRRVMQALVTLGVFIETDDGRFGATAISEWFRDTPGTLRGAALMLPGESYDAFGALMHSLRTGEPAFVHVYGMTHFEQLARDPERSVIFNAAMQAGTEAVRDVLVAAYDFTGMRSVIDVGGGRGTLIAGILKSNLSLRGAILDLPAGLAEAPEYLKAQGVGERCEVVSGNFFESVPAGHDAYFLKQVLHDWSDEKAIAILSTVRKAMGVGSRLVLVERIMAARAEDSAVARELFMVDVHMLVVLGGRERTVDEFSTLFQEAGLRLTRVIPTASIHNLIEAVPV
jgi:hypothetical protein